jgi:hypothetical protein
MITTEAMKKKSRRVHYVNNRDFFNALVDYRQRVYEARENEEPIPRVPNYIGECLLKIATHVSFKPNWVNYSYKEDMISDSIENSIQYILNFNPERSSNPFSYFTSVIENAFKRRILKEKRQMDIKERILEQAGFDEVFFDDGSDNSNSSDYNSIKDSIYSRGRL